MGLRPRLEAGFDSAGRGGGSTSGGKFFHPQPDSAPAAAGSWGCWENSSLGASGLRPSCSFLLLRARNLS